MDTNSNYKNRALSSLQGRWLNPCLGTLICFAIGGALSSVGMKSSIVYVISLLLFPLVWGYEVELLVFVRRGTYDIGMMVQRGYQDFVRIFTTMLLRYVYIMLWSLLLVIPGIIKTFSYALTTYILLDNPQMKNNEAIELSMAMMDGHKMQLFLLFLSFIGWAILSAFTLGIGFIWLYPYVNTSCAHFYEDRKKEYFEANQAQ